MKPDDIPQDIWDVAEKAYWPAVTGGSFTDDPWLSIARAILAEREACAVKFDKLAHLMDGDGVPVKAEIDGTWHSDDPMYVARYCREMADEVRAGK